MKNINYIFFIILLSVSSLSSQNVSVSTDTAPLAAADRILSASYPDGHYSGTFWIMNQWGAKESFMFHLFIRDKDRFWRIINERKGAQLRMLSRPDSLEIFAQDLRISSKFHLKSEDRFRKVMGSGFQYADLAGFALSSLFRAEGSKEVTLAGKRVIATELAPLHAGITESAVLFSDPESSYRPVRIDFYRKNRVLYRSMRFFYADTLRIPETSGLQGKDFPVRTEVADLDTNDFSGIETESFDGKRPPAPLFNSTNI